MSFSKNKVEDIRNCHDRQGISLLSTTYIILFNKIKSYPKDIIVGYQWLINHRSYFTVKLLVEKHYEFDQEIILNMYNMLFTLTRSL